MGYEHPTENVLPIDCLISRLEYMLPGSMIKDQLRFVEKLTYQSIADMLGSRGMSNDSNRIAPLIPQAHRSFQPRHPVLALPE